MGGAVGLVLEQARLYTNGNGARRYHSGYPSGDVRCAGGTHCNILVVGGGDGIMPRVALCQEQKIDYMVYDLPYWFEKEARKKGLRQKDLAKALGISPQSWSDRKKRKSNGKPRDTFSYGELLILFKLLEIPDEEILKLMKL